MKIAIANSRTHSSVAATTSAATRHRSSTSPGTSDTIVTAESAAAGAARAATPRGRPRRWRRSRSDPAAAARPARSRRRPSRPRPPPGHAPGRTSAQPPSRRTNATSAEHDRHDPAVEVRLQRAEHDHDGEQRRRSAAARGVAIDTAGRPSAQEPRSTQGLTREDQPAGRRNPRAQSLICHTMTTSQLLLNLGILGTRPGDQRRRPPDRPRALHPPGPLHGARRAALPRSTADAGQRSRVRTPGAAAGLGLGVLAASSARSRPTRRAASSPAPAPPSPRSGSTVVGARIAFAYGADHLFPHAIATFSQAHDITAQRRVGR